MDLNQSSTAVRHEAYRRQQTSHALHNFARGITWLTDSYLATP